MVEISNREWGMGLGEWDLGNGAPKETSQQNRSLLASIPRYIKSPPGGTWGLGDLGR